MLILLFALAFALGCSGKTTVKEELTDTSPRPKTAEENKQATDQPSETTTNEEKKKEGETGEQRPAPTPGTDSGSSGSMTPSGGSDNSGGGKTEEGGGREAREKYYQDNLAYPGATQDTSFQAPETPGFTGKTLISNDAAGTVAKWYMDKFGEKATMNQSPSRSGGEQYNIYVTDKDNGYTANIMINRIDKNNPTRILISLNSE